MLFEVSPTDPVTFGAVALCVILATKVDPLIAFALRVNPHACPGA